MLLGLSSSLVLWAGTVSKTTAERVCLALCTCKGRSGRDVVRAEGLLAFLHTEVFIMLLARIGLRMVLSDVMHAT